MPKTPKTHTSFVCQNCGYESPRWMGRCPDCGSWNTLVEEKKPAGGTKGGSAPPVTLSGTRPVPVLSVKGDEQDRFLTGIGELDRVLGGGIVRGSLVLIGGDPGVGKSTLLLQMAENVSRSGQRVLYVSGEESVAQTRMRAERIGVLSQDLLVAAETSVEVVMDYVRAESPALLIVDSVQTMHVEDLESAPGSVGQVRETASRFLNLAKGLGVAVFLVGHMTKSGAIAGPRVLEHIVDTVLYFEGEQTVNHRILRAQKNRFGSTNEIGVFEMEEQGLIEVTNPSELFLAERPEGVPGSAVAVCCEGSRPVLVEVQALVSPSALGMPRRMAQGIEQNRLALLLAVLEKRAGLAFGTQDVYLKVAGGLQVTEPAVDLAVALAMASSLLDRPLDMRVALFGEVGLGGEIRATGRAKERLTEAGRLGFIECLLPKSNVQKMGSPAGIKPRGVSNIREAIDHLLR
jgi:DNA repair protein RadA/Sms